MLQPSHRLRRPAEVNQVRQTGKSWRHPLVILLVQSNSLDVSRFAFIASRHVGKAVQRNRAKRVLREMIRVRISDIQPGWDCILIARPLLLQAANGEVDTAVTQLLQRAKLLP